MDNRYINLSLENLADEHICCIIRTKKPHMGVEAKKQWLAQRLKEGHVFRKLDVKGTVFIEYAPLETAWTPIIGENYLYVYCLWVVGEFRGKGHATALLEYCIADAKAQGRSGICMLGAKKQKSWFSDQEFAKRHGFKVVDSTENGYELRALSFDGSTPRFTESAKLSQIENEEFTLFYDMQCPFIQQKVEKLKEYCKSSGVSAAFIEVDSLQKAKELPCVFNNWAAFYKGRFETVNLLDETALRRILGR